MPRDRKPPRLYFDKARGRWAIRDGQRFIRISSVHQNCPQDWLDDYLGRKPRRGEKSRRPGEIYVIAVGPYIKIGFTAVGIATRLKYLKVAMPELPVILATFAGNTRDELALHHRFSAHRANGEWFRNEGPVTAWIATLECFKALEGHSDPKKDCKLLKSLVGGEGLEPPAFSV